MSNEMFNRYPMTDFQAQNIDWLLRKVAELETTMRTWIATSEVKFADPINWDIRRAYPKNNIVLGPNGNSYLAKTDVPTGIDISNTEYWFKIADNNAQIAEIMQSVAAIQNVLSSNNILDTDSCIFIGDSYTQANSLGDQKNKRFSTLLAGWLGLIEYNFGLGSCAYLAGNEPYPAQAQRAISEVANKNKVRYIFISGLRNDTQNIDSIGAYNAAIDNTIKPLLQNFPNAEIIITPVLWDYRFMPSAYLRHIGAVHQVAENYNRVRIIDNGHTWLTGYNNEILYENGATVHPTVTGHHRIAMHLYSALMGNNYSRSNQYSFTPNQLNENASYFRNDISYENGRLHYHCEFKPTAQMSAANIFKHVLTDANLVNFYIGEQDLFVNIKCRDLHADVKAKLKCTVTKPGTTSSTYELSLYHYDGAFNLDSWYYLDIDVPYGILPRESNIT